MLVICKRDLKEPDFARIRDKLSDLPYAVRWGRRGGRLALYLEGASGDPAEMSTLAEDPAVEFILKRPSPREITRLFSRRNLLDFSLACTGILTAAAVLGPLGIYISRPPGGRSPRSDVAVGKAGSIPVDGARTRLVNGQEYLIIRRGETSYHALSATCTHSQVCLLGWDRRRQQIVCPCHHGVFDLQGNVVSGPPPRPLPRFEVVERDGILYMRREPQ